MFFEKDIGFAYRTTPFDFVHIYISEQTWTCLPWTAQLNLFIYFKVDNGWQTVLATRSTDRTSFLPNLNHTYISLLVHNSRDFLALIFWILLCCSIQQLIVYFLSCGVVIVHQPQWKWKTMEARQGLIWCHVELRYTPTCFVDLCCRIKGVQPKLVPPAKLHCYIIRTNPSSLYPVTNNF